MASKSKTVAELIEVDGDIIVNALDNVDPSFVSDKANSSTGALGLPTGTTAQRPGSPSIGYTRMNTTTGSIEFYDGTNWIATNLIPEIISVTGTINDAYETNLTLSLTGNTDVVDVIFTEGGVTIASVDGQTVTSGSLAVAVPAAVYGQTAGDTISISIKNQDGTPSSNQITKTVIAAPTGGTITTFGGYRIHTFTTSASFVVGSGDSKEVDYLLVGGGGGGGGAGGPNSGAGGGGAGGLLTNFGGSSVSLSSGTYSVVVGNGGSGGVAIDNGHTSTKGTDTTFNGLTAYAGGAAPNSNSSSTDAKRNGGSGAGGTGNPSSSTGYPGTGISGQGNNGGTSGYTSPNYGAGGGGGKGAVGGNGSNTDSGDGGAGYDASSYVGTSIGDSGWFAGGGGGGIYDNTSFASGGQGGGGGGGGYGSTPGSNGGTNTGGGGGGTGGRASGGSAQVGGNGGKGICIIRYAI